MLAPIQPMQDPLGDVDRLGDEIAELSAQIQAATYQLLLLIREFDSRGGWNTGFRSCAHWLNWRTGLDMGAAREKVRVARALEDLPEISEAMRRVDRIEAMEESSRQQEHRYLRVCPDEDGMLMIRARLTPEVGAVFLKSLEAANEALVQRSQESEESDWTELPAEQRCADALELVTESVLEGGLDPGTAGDRYQVVVHVREDVSAETLLDFSRGC